MKFATIISASAPNILASRASALAEQVSLEQSALITDLRRKKLQLEAKLANLFDLAPDSTVSLKVGGGQDFNAKRWVDEVQSTKIEIVNLEVELDLAEATNKEWFTTTETPTAE